MATAAEYQQQLQDMGNMPDFKNIISEAYNAPVIKPITKEAADLYSSYLPTIFSAFQGGTGAADMSAAAKLATMGSALGRLGGNIAANKDVQSFYRTQISDIANAELAKWQQRQQQLKDLWQMAFQREEADRQQRNLAAQQASSDWYSKLMSSLQSVQAPAQTQARTTTPLLTPETYPQFKAILDTAKSIQKSPLNTNVLNPGRNLIQNTIQNLPTTIPNIASGIGKIGSLLGF